MRFLALFVCLTLSSVAHANANRSVAQVGSTKALGVADTSNVSTGQSLSALFSTAGGDWIQALLGVESTRGSFVFGLGGIYKFTVAGNARTGFHVGPGATIGTVAVGGKSKFAFGFSGLAGGHFTLFDRLMLSVDGGPMLAVVDGDANFALKPMGTLLGLSVHYLF